MNLLALDTSSDACSVALDCAGRCIERHVVAPREQTRLLVPLIREVLAEGGLTVPRLDAIVLGNGPGSFIGIRIAASVAQGLAYGAGKPLLAVSSLACVAAEAFAVSAADAVAVAQDAHRDEVYLGCFRRDRSGLPVPLEEAVLCRGDGVPRLPPLDAAVWRAAGAGWQRYPGLLERARPHLVLLAGAALPRARFLLPMGAAAWRHGEAIPPGRLEPAYVRARVANEPGLTPS